MGDPHGSICKQVRPSAALASLRALRPAYGRPQCAVLQSVQMCVTIDTCHCVALQGSYECSARPPCSIMGTAMAAVLPRFRDLGKGIS